MKRRKLRTPLERCVQWEGAFASYAANFVRVQGWRIRATIGDQEDALQECAYVFAKCFARYRDTVDNPAWFMSLYKMALANHWHTLASRDGRQRAHDAQIEIEPIEMPTGPLVTMFHMASDELRYVLGMLADAPSEILQIVFAGKTEQETNQRLSIWTGIKYGTPDLLGELKLLLTSGAKTHD